MRNVVIPVDGSNSALRAVQHVIRQRTLHPERVQVTLMNVQPRLPRHITRFATASAVRELQAERAEEAMAEALELLREANVSHEIRVYKGDAARHIVQTAHECKADCIVMGTTRKNALTRFFQGSVVNKVMAMTETPVEIVSHGEAGKLERFGIPIGLGLTFLWLAIE